MHTYRKSGKGAETVWTVGVELPISDPDGDFPYWRPLKDFRTEAEAAAYVSYLNGGARNAGNHFPPASD